MVEPARTTSKEATSFQKVSTIGFKLAGSSLSVAI
jgi:hypothetical protein